MDPSIDNVDTLTNPLIKRLTTLKITSYALMLPCLQSATADDYAIVDSRWNLMVADGRFGAPGVKNIWSEADGLKL